MMASRHDYPLSCPSQAELDWLVGQRVSTAAMVRPSAMMIAIGAIADDGLFEHDERGDRWLAFEEAEDIVFWQRRRGTIATYANRVFGLGEAAIDSPGTYAFDCALNIFANPLDWLRSGRDGIVVVNWDSAFDRLRDAPRIAIVEELLPLYRRHMKPPRMPELFVIPSRRHAA